MSEPLTRSLGSFVSGLRLEGIPTEALGVVHTGFADCVGTMIAGSIEDPPKILHKALAPPSGDATLYLVGLRSLKSTGCKPLDEHMLLGHRHFVTVFSKDGAPDLDSFTVETTSGTSRDGVRLIKKGETSVSFGC